MSVERKPTVGLMVLVVLLAFALRVYGLGWHGMTYDEAASVAFGLPGAAHILTYPQGAIYESPPLFYLVLHFWMALTGQSQFALRFLPLCFSVLLVPLVGQLGRRLLSPLVGLLAALVGAVSVIQVYYAQEVRMYTLVPLLSLVATYAFARVTEGRDVTHSSSSPALLLAPIPSRPVVYWVVYVVAMALAIFGHYYAVLVLIFHNLYALIAWRRGRLSLRTWALIQALTLAGPLLYLAFASGVVATVANIAGGGDVTDNLPRLRGLWLDFALGNVSTWLRRSPLIWVLLGLLLLGVVSALRLPGRSDGGMPASLRAVWPVRLNSGGVFLVLYLLVPLAVAVALPYRLAPRYLLTVAPAYYLVIGAGLAALRPAWPALVLGLAVVLGSSGYTLTAYRQLVKNDYQQLTATIEAQEEPGDVILLSGPRQHLLLRYYYHGRLPFRSVPDVELPPSTEVDAPRLDPLRAEADLPAATAGARRVWLLLSGEDETDPDGLAERWLNAHSAFQSEQRAQRGRLRLYQLPTNMPVPQQPIGGQFGEVLALDWAGLPAAAVAAGERLQVRLGWRVLADLPPDLKFTLRLLDGNGERVAQRDDRVGGGYVPPAGRPSGSRFVDYLSLPVPPDLPPGRYTLAVGLYLGEAGRDLPWKTGPTPPAAAVPPVPPDLAPLGQIEILGAGQRSSGAP